MKINQILTTYKSSKFTAVNNTYEEATDAKALSLSITYWMESIERMRAAMRELSESITEATPDSTAIATAALQCFHHLHTAGSHHVSLPLSVWSAWQEGLAHYFDGVPSLDGVRQNCLDAFDQLFSTCLWGTSVSFKTRLSGLAARWETKQKGTTAEKQLELSTIAEFEKGWFKEVNGFYRLAYGSGHLFRDYPVAGEMERELLSATLADEEHVEVLECATRDSFRRDFAAPSCMVGGDSAWESYTEFEVDDKKESAMRSLMEKSRSSPLYKAQASLYTELEASHDAPASALPANVNSPDFVRKADEVARLWGQSPAGSLTAVGFTMQRLLEFESFPPAVHPSRLAFVLHLLQKWLAHYCTSPHRWGVHSCFTEEDDSDLWTFLLERHEVLCRLALLGDRDESNQRKDALLYQVDTLKTVTQSVLHCLFVYLRHIRMTPMSHEKLSLRCNATITRCEGWLDTFVVGTHSNALMNDVYEESEAFEDAGEADRFVLRIEARLKLVLLDAFSSFAQRLPRVAERNSARLIQVVEALLATLNSSALTPELTDLWRCTLRLLQRALFFVPRDPGEGDQSFASLAALFKQLLRVSAEKFCDGEKVEAVSEAWMVFSSQILPAIPTSSGSVAEQQMLPLPYDTRLNAGRTLGHGCTLVDVLFDTRKAMKRVRSASPSC